MKQLAPVIAAALIALSPAADATVIWSFYETAITSCNGGTCVLPPQPFVLLTLTLPGPTSAGTATWPPVISGTRNPPVYTGDSFALSLPFGPTATPLLTPAFAGVPDCHGSSPAALCDFDISWTEVAGVLTAVNINVDESFNNIGGMAGKGPFGLTGGPLASDLILGGCSSAQCTVAGFWQSGPTVPEPMPEPMSVALLVAGLVGTWLSRRLAPRSRVSATSKART
jgi:hypothetical protein